MEQQPPCAQFPQTVLPLLAPQEPSFVMAPVGGASVGAPNTGSACDDEGVGGVVPVPPVVQPLWHPCALSQLMHRQPRVSTLPFNQLTEQSSFHTIYHRSPVRVILISFKKNRTHDLPSG